MSAIESGKKIHTVRRRAASDGEHLFLRSGQRLIKKVCTGTQKFEIKPAPYGSVAYIEGKILGADALSDFAENGGFASARQMFEYYGDEFSGYIIHWTEKRY